MKPQKLGLCAVVVVAFLWETHVAPVSGTMFGDRGDSSSLLLYPHAAAAATRCNHWSPSSAVWRRGKRKFSRPPAASLVANAIHAGGGGELPRAVPGQVLPKRYLEEQEEEEHDPYDSPSAADEYTPPPADYLSTFSTTPLMTTGGGILTRLMKLVRPWLLDNPQRLARITASGLQIGLAAYLTHAVWKAVVELLEEYTKDVASVGNDHVFAKQADVVKAVAYLQQISLWQGNSNQNTDKSVPPHRLPSLPILEVAQKLVASGIPLCSSIVTKPGMTALGLSEPSVESILLSLTQSEANILLQCLWIPPLSNAASEHDTTNFRHAWDSVAGLTSVKDRLWSIVATLRGKDKSLHQASFGTLFDANQNTAGVLLYGPPGCGKTLLVKALAQRSRLPCLVVTPSILLRKYVGETNQQVRSLFSLAAKLAPSILCIDELDGLFRERSDTEHEVSRDLKTEFLQWLDGMLSNHPLIGSVQDGSDTGKILVIGATNRPFDVDSAVLRRLPQAHFVGLPDAEARALLLRTLLHSVPIGDDFDYDQIAAQTEGYSPSDLRQVLQTAAMLGPLKEGNNRPLTTEDATLAVESSPPTPMSQNYRTALTAFARLQNTEPRETATTTNPSAAADRHWCRFHERWESAWGNFYDLGSIDVDNATFAQIADILKQMQENRADSDAGDDADNE